MLVVGPDHQGETTPMGDDSFAAFYTASYQRLLGQLFALTGDLAEAENLLQEAYARAFARWAQVRAYDYPEAWVRRVALNPRIGLARHVSWYPAPQPERPNNSRLRLGPHRGRRPAESRGQPRTAGDNEPLGQQPFTALAWGAKPLE
jgi:Sigma-70 region 2